VPESTGLVAEMRIASHENHERARAKSHLCQNHNLSLLFHIRCSKVKTFAPFCELILPFNKVIVVLRLPAKSSVSTTLSALFPAHPVFRGFTHKDFPDRSRLYFALYSIVQRKFNVQKVFAER